MARGRSAIWSSTRNPGAWPRPRRCSTPSCGASWQAALLLLHVPEHGDRRGDVAGHGRAPRRRLHELAERHGDALIQHALLHLLGQLELLLGIARARELHAQLLDLLVERPAELSAVAGRLG